MRKGIYKTVFWSSILLVFVLLFSIAVAVYFPKAYASTSGDTVTGIPLDVLFSIIGALLVGVYADMKYQLKKLQEDSAKRSGNIIHMRTLLGFICKKLDIPFDANHDK
jgi:hypothetical protein